MMLMKQMNIMVMYNMMYKMKDCQIVDSPFFSKILLITANNIDFSCSWVYSKSVYFYLLGEKWMIFYNCYCLHNRFLNRRKTRKFLIDINPCSLNRMNGLF